MSPGGGGRALIRTQIENAVTILCRQPHGEEWGGDGANTKERSPR
jgi:hypothetical protein